MSAWRLSVLLLCTPLAVGLSACNQVAENPTGKNTLTVEVTNLVGAQNSEVGAELSQNISTSEFRRAPSWQFAAQSVTSSPFSYSDTLESLPPGEFTLSVMAGSDAKSQTALVKGQGCEMTLTMGEEEAVTISIDGLNQFGDKGYGPCNATTTR